MYKNERLLIQINTAISRIEKLSEPGQRLRYERVIRNFTANQLGTMAGHREGYIINLEKGFNPIYYEDAIVLGNILEIEPEVLLDEYTLFCKLGYGDRIRRIRNAFGLSQTAFANILGTCRSTISVWEIEYNNQHPSRKIYDKLMELAENNGVNIYDS